MISNADTGYDPDSDTEGNLDPPRFAAQTQARHPAYPSIPVIAITCSSAS